MKNQAVAKILRQIGELLKLKGVAYKPAAYVKAAQGLENLEKDIAVIYQEGGLKSLQAIPGVGKSIAQKIEEYLQKDKIEYYEGLENETAIRQIVTYYFQTKGLSLDELKRDAKKQRIVYSRYTKPAKQLLELAGSLPKAKEAISKVSEWAKSRNLDYVIETVFKRWLELDQLKPKEIVKKPFYEGQPMIWSETRKKWYVIDQQGEWLEFADEEKKMEWRVTR